MEELVPRTNRKPNIPDKRCDRCGNTLWNLTGWHIVVEKATGKRKELCGECFAKAGDTVIEQLRAR